MVKLKDVVFRINNDIDRFNTDVEFYLGKGHGECGEIAITEHGLLKKDVGSLGFKFHFCFEPGDTLFFSRSFALRKAGMAMYRGLCSDSTYILRSKNEEILYPEYIPAIIQSDRFWEYCDTHHTGGVNFLINWSTLADYEFELPSLDEQKEIATKIWSAYRLKQSYKKLLSATREMVKSRFIEMFGDPREMKGPSVLSNYVEMKAGCSITANSIEKELSSSNYPCYGGNGLRGYTSSFTHDGLFPLIGRQGALCGNVQLAEGKFFASEHAVVVTAKDGVNVTWLYYCLVLMDLNRLARGVAQPGLAVNQLNQLPFDLPPVALQEQFAAIYRQADKSEFELKKAIEAIDAVIKSLINN